MVPVIETKRNGIRMKVPVVDDSDGRRPAIFDSHEGFYHREAMDPEATTVTVWLNTELSPQKTVDDVKSEKSPVSKVLTDNS